STGPAAARTRRGARQAGTTPPGARAGAEGRTPRRQEGAVETVHGRAALAVAVINPQRTHDPADGPPRVVPGVVPRLVPGRMHGRSMTQTATSRSRVA